MTPSQREALWAQLGHDEQRIALRFIERIIQGRKAYGELVLEHDSRDFREEALQEALDLAAYLVMAVERRKEHQGELEDLRATVKQAGRTIMRLRAELAEARRGENDAAGQGETENRLAAPPRPVVTGPSESPADPTEEREALADGSGAVVMPNGGRKP